MIQGQASRVHRRYRRKESRVWAFSDLEAEDVAGGAEGQMLDVESADPAQIALAREGGRARRALLLELPTEQRAALLLSAAGFGTREIAAAIGLSERAAREVGECRFWQKRR